MKFRVAHTLYPRAHSPAGSRDRNTYVREVSVDGVKSLRCSGKDCLFEKIQLASRGTLVSDLIIRAQQGDTSAIMPSEGVIADLTTLPSSLLEAHNQICKARSVFASLPAEVRRDFGGSFNSFMAAVNDGSFTSTYKLTRKTEPVAAFSDKQVEQLKSIFGGKNNE